MPTDTHQLQLDLEQVTEQRDRAMRLLEAAQAHGNVWERRYRDLHALFSEMQDIANQERQEAPRLIDACCEEKYRLMAEAIDLQAKLDNLKAEHAKVVNWWNADIAEFRAHAKASL